MRSTAATIVLSLVLLPSFACAQSIRQEEASPLQPPSLIRAGDVNGQLIIIGFSLASLPYLPMSATIESEIQTLDDRGNYTVRRHSARVFRDLCGSLRRETDINAIGAPSNAQLINVQIYDATTESNITLFPWKKLAFVMQDQDSAPLVAASPCLQQPSQKPSRPAAKTPEARQQASGHLSFMEPEVSGPAAPIALLPDIRREELGAEIRDGMSLRHGRETVNYPAGLPGEKDALTIVTDYWYSQELQAFVEIRQVGPKNIVQTLALRNISRENPASALFKIPKTYAIHKTRMTPVETENTL
jgi:hypothetical protein